MSDLGLRVNGIPQFSETFFLTHHNTRSSFPTVEPSHNLFTGSPLSVSGCFQFLINFEIKVSETHQASLSHRGGPASGQNRHTHRPGPRAGLSRPPPPHPRPGQGKRQVQPLPLLELIGRRLSPAETIVLSGYCLSLQPGNRGGLSSQSSVSQSNYSRG